MIEFQLNNNEMIEVYKGDVMCGHILEIIGEGYHFSFKDDFELSSTELEAIAKKMRELNSNKAHGGTIIS